MRLVLAFLLFGCLALAGCSGRVVDSNANTATASSPSSLSSGSNPSNANPPAKAGYPQATVDAFLKSCQGAGSSLPFCRCVLEKVQAKYSFEEFAKIEEEIAEGKPRKEFLDFTAKTRTECEK